jgi:hypothetical protein
MTLNPDQPQFIHVEGTPSKRSIKEGRKDFNQNQVKKLIEIHSLRHEHQRSLHSLEHQLSEGDQPSVKRIQQQTKDNCDDGDQQ